MSFKNRFAKFTARSLSLLFFLILGALCVSAEQVKNLKPQGYVNDFAGVLSAPAKAKLAALCAEVDQKAGAQIAVVTVSSLEGEPVEQFSIELATQWGVGPKQQSRGVLILLAPNDRKYRVEVGYGLEPILPDGKVGGFGREMVPYLRGNDYDGAMMLLTQRVAAVIAADRGLSLDTLAGAPPPEPESDYTSPVLRFLVTNLLWVIIVVFALMSPLLNFISVLLFGPSIRSSRRRGGWWMAGPGYGGGSWGGGGFGGGGGGGGGFGGFGGGSFGGGGASGSW
jgi:uncharacterized protein